MQLKSQNGSQPAVAKRPSIKNGIRQWLRRRRAFFMMLGLVTTLITLVFIRRIVNVIGPGEGGVRYSVFTGTVTETIYNEGIHIIFPWEKMYVYNARVQIIKHKFGILTKSGLLVEMGIVVRFRPIFELLGVLHQSVGPDYPHIVVLPQIESVLRKGLGQRSPEDIYTNKDFLLTRLINEAIEEVGRKFIDVDDVLIVEVSLPEPVRQAIEHKLIEEQAAITYDYTLQKEKKEATRKRIESSGIHDYQKTISQTLDEKLLAWEGIQATLALANSKTTKLVVIGGGKDGNLPIILGDSLLKKATEGVVPTPDTVTNHDSTTDVSQDMPASESTNQAVNNNSKKVRSKR